MYELMVSNIFQKHLTVNNFLFASLKLFTNFEHAYWNPPQKERLSLSVIGRYSLVPNSHWLQGICARITWSQAATALQIILELCIPEKELAKTRSEMLFIYFQSHSWYSVRNYKIPKGIMKTRFEPRLSQGCHLKKKFHTLDLNSEPLYMQQVFCHWTIKADTKHFHISILVPFRTTKDSFLPVTFTGFSDLFPQLGSCHQQLCGNSLYLTLVVQC